MNCPLGVALTGALLGLSGCVGTTGSSLFTFDAAAAGPEDANGTLTFESPRGYDITLEKAKVRVGAVYLNDALPVSGAQATSCVLPGIYVAEVTHELVVDALDPTPQPFPGVGEAIGDTAVAGEVWLMHGDVNDPTSTDFILEIAGKAVREGVSYPFDGTLTIGENRAPPVVDPSQPSLNPICKQRIVTPIREDITLAEGGSLLLRIDPRRMFTNVDFRLLPQVSRDPPAYRFEDDADEPASLSLYRGLQNAAAGQEGVYDILWQR